MLTTWEERIGVMLAGLLMTGIVYCWMCLVCISNQNYVSPEDYARMSQEIVEESIEP